MAKAAVSPKADTAVAMASALRRPMSSMVATTPPIAHPRFGKVGKDSARGWPTLNGVDVLLVEDDEAIARPLLRGLEREGFKVTWVATGLAAVDAADVDVVLLDLGLPDIDGYEVCRRIRARSDVPIVFLTARSDEVDRVVGLELGADDYVVKPFGFRELVARIRAVTRRRGPAPPAHAGGPVHVGALELDRRTRRVTLGGAMVDLTPKEFDVVSLLAQDPGAVFARQQIMERVWGHPWYGPTKTLDVHVASIRKKLGDPGWIETVRGVGFRIQSAGSAAVDVADGDADDAGASS
jgi:DNA-binding response OmpR family regulator